MQRHHLCTKMREISVRFITVQNVLYTVFHKKWHPFSFFHNFLKWWSVYTKFAPDVTEETLINTNSRYFDKMWLLVILLIVM